MSISSNLPSEYRNLKVEIPPLNFENIKFETIMEEKAKPNRCCFNGCKKKLALTDFACKCGKIHCSAHRIPEIHNCTFDFKQNYQQNLLHHMSTAVIASKIDTI